MIETTTAPWYGGRLSLIQPTRGYRVAVDAALLAAAVPTAGLKRALELGTGVGAAALALALRAPAARVDAIELQPALAEIGQANVRANGLEARVTVREGDVLRLPPDLAGFDEAFFNPPYLTPETNDPSADPVRRIATVEGPATLAAWLRAARRALRPGGGVTLIHRADRLADVLGAMADADIGGPVVFPLWPRAGAEAKRVLLRGRAGRRGRLRLLAGLVLHEGDGFTPAARAVLEGAASVDLDAP